MDVKNINHVFVVANIDRTATVGTEVIDGLTVPTGSVQIHAPLVDSGAAALSYYNNGELVITDESGRTLNATLAVKAVKSITFHQKSLNGLNHFSSHTLEGSAITSYHLTPYKAPAEHVAIVHTIDASLTDHSYMLKVRRFGSDNNKLKETTVKTAWFKSAAAGSSAAQIATGLVDYINLNFSTDPLMPISAEVTGAASDEITISALPLPFEVGKYNYNKLDFGIELVNFTATVLYNDKADLVRNAITHDQATGGAGTYAHVVEMENFAKMYFGANTNQLSPNYRRTIVDMDSEIFEDDGSTPNRYDTVVINWARIEGNFSQDVRHAGAITLFLPVDDNATSQVGEAAIGIMAVLDKYIVTEYGIGIAQIANIT